MPADGYYEWQAARGGKLPHHLALPGGALFAMAAIYEHWDDGQGQQLETVALLTCEAVGAVREVHTRMPVLLSPSAYSLWLDPATDPAEALALCEPGIARGLEARRVGKRVNRVSNDDPACLELEPLPLFGPEVEPWSSPQARLCSRGRRAMNPAMASRVRSGLLVAIGVLYVLSIPWYREAGALPEGGASGGWLGLPDWVGVALACYVAIAVLNSVAWALTEVDDPSLDDEDEGS